MIVDGSSGFYVLATDAAGDWDAPAVSGLGLHSRHDAIVVTTVGESQDRRVEVLVRYFDEYDDWLADFPGGGWRLRTATTEVVLSDVLTLTTKSGKTMELTPAGGRFRVAVYARIMAPGEWAARDPQEHHIITIWPLDSGVPYARTQLPHERPQSREGRSLSKDASSNSAGDLTWIHDVLFDAACVTAVTGKTREAVLADFGADPSTETVFDPSDYGETGGDFFVSVVDVAGGVVAVEFNGYLGSLPEILGRLSSNGRAASMFWNVNDDNAFSCAEAGGLVASVDMYDADDPDGVDLPDEVRSTFELAAGEEPDLHAIGLGMVETFAGIRVHKKDVTAIHTAFRVGGGD